MFVYLIVSGLGLRMSAFHYEFKFNDSYGLAQSVERSAGNLKVPGLIPTQRMSSTGICTVK